MMSNPDINFYIYLNNNLKKQLKKIITLQYIFTP